MTETRPRVDFDEEIRAILEGAATIALVGASPKPWRDSNGIMAMLLDAGYNVIPVNPNYAEVHGRPCVPDLRSITVPVDIVDVFRRPSAIASLIDEAVAVGAPVVWLQPGAVEEDAARRGADAGVTIIAGRCIAVEYGRLVRSRRAPKNS